MEWQFSFVFFEITQVKNSLPEPSLFCSFLQLEVVLDLVLCTFVGQSWAWVKERNYKRINVRQVPEEMAEWFWGVGSESMKVKLGFWHQVSTCCVKGKKRALRNSCLTQAPDGKWNANMKLSFTFQKIIPVAWHCSFWNVPGNLLRNLGNFMLLGYIFT